MGCDAVLDGRPSGSRGPISPEQQWAPWRSWSAEVDRRQRVPSENRLEAPMGPTRPSAARRSAEAAESIPKGLPAGSEGVETSYVPTAAQRSQWSAELQEEKRRADERWDAVIRAKDWDTLVTPLECFQFETGLTSDPRRTPEYRQKVLDELGLLSGEGLEHLDPYDKAASVEVFSRKTGAFLAKDTPRTCLRAFQHDVLVSGAPCTRVPY